VTDNAAGIRGAVRHLVEQGHRRIAYLGDMRSIATAAERHQGYVEELAEQKIGVDATLVRLDLRGIEKAEAAAREVLARPQRPTAIIAGQNLITIGAFPALRALDVHRRGASVGFGYFVLADVPEPRLTVRAPVRAAIR